MSDSTPPVVEEKAVEPPFKAFATEADYKEFKAKAVEEKERELVKLRRENEKLTREHQTEDQRQAEVQKQALEDEKKKVYEEADRRAGFLGIALSKGHSREQAAKLYQLAGPEWDDPQEAYAQVAKDLGITDKKPVAGGGGRNPDSEAIAYTPEFVQEMIAKHGSGWYMKHRKEIEEYRQANYAGIKSIIRS